MNFSKPPFLKTIFILHQKWGNIPKSQKNRGLPGPPLFSVIFEFTPFLAYKTFVFNSLSSAAGLETTFGVYTFRIFQLLHDFTPDTRCVNQCMTPLNQPKTAWNRLKMFQFSYNSIKMMIFQCLDHTKPVLNIRI